MDKPSERDANYFYQQLTPSVESSLSRQQRQEFLQILNRAVSVPSKKLLSLQLSFWLFRHFYLVVYWGIDSRSRERNCAIPMVSGLLANGTIILSKGLCILLAGLITFWVAYEIKSLLGIDLFENFHLLDLIRSI
ncbi:hypothetical protein [Shewanella violacea]|uniref:Uncharacterized protein n=1 Tax=Shewanella violacea (strain JCM 10179 / CIP 106290 / LMG 19151 / DSS12) TaxID=637905 RepID=D4ZIM6_SHEVD|nr:hypothetical protein [Shewanella violacea]BAJ01525.1 hypothetical protein SVI_1554 [Shewanella violacea DSS12]